MEIKSQFEYLGRSRQVRMFCIVEPYGDFENDPDEDITEIKLIDPKDFRETVGWGEIGDRILELSLEEKNNILRI